MSYDDTIVDAETITTAAGDYTLTWHYDQDSQSPLPDDDAMVFWIGNGRDLQINSLHRSDAGSRLDTLIFDHGSSESDAITRRYEKWRAITGSPWQLVTGSGNGNVQSHWWNWFVLVDTSADYADPVAAVTSTMDEYEQWARGDVYGFVLRGPDGDELETVWNFIGDDGKRAAREDIIDPAVAYDVEQRQKKASRVGAGFVGLI